MENTLADFNPSNAVEFDPSNADPVEFDPSNAEEVGGSGMVNLGDIEDLGRSPTVRLSGPEINLQRVEDAVFPKPAPRAESFAVDVNVSGGSPETPAPRAESFSVDMGADQANRLRDRERASQEDQDAAVENARVFSGKDNPWRVVDGEMIIDPERFGIATEMMWNLGVIGSDQYAKWRAAAPDVEAQVAARKELVRRAGGSPELKAALSGAGTAGVALAGGVAAGSLAGRVLSGAPKPIALGGSLLAGAGGAVASGIGADAALEEVAKVNAAADSVLAAKELNPGYNLAGSLATLAVPMPGAVRNVVSAINTMRAEKGSEAAAKMAAAVLGGGAALGAGSDAAVQLASGAIFDALHPELQPGIRAEMERQAQEAGKRLAARPEYSPTSTFISGALGALTAGMGVKSRNKTYAPSELVSLEERVHAGRASRVEAEDYKVMRAAISTLRKDEGMLSAGGVQRAVVDVYGSRALDVTKIIDPRFRTAVIGEASRGVPAAEVPRLAASNPDPMAAVPVGAGSDPVYQGPNFVNRGGPAPAFSGGERVLAGAAGVSGALQDAAIPGPKVAEFNPANAVEVDAPKAKKSFPMPNIDPGMFPVISSLVESPVRMSTSGSAGGENDDKPTMKELGIFYKLTHRTSGQPYDVRAQELYDEGILKNPSAEDLFSALRAEVAMFRQVRSQERLSVSEEKLLVKQGKDFNKDVLAAPKAKDAKIAVPVGDLQPGDKVKIGEEEMVVKEIDPETFDVVLQDGRKYGLQVVEDGRTLWVESADLQGQDPADVSWPAADPKARTIDSVGEGKLFSEGEMPFNLTGEEDLNPMIQRAADARAAAAEAQAAAERAQGGFSFADEGPVGEAPSNLLAQEGAPVQKSGMVGRVAKNVDSAGILAYAYTNGNDALQKAHDRFGGPKDLLRSASQILGESSRGNEGNDPKAAGNDDVSRLARFARDSGLMMDADKVRAYLSNNAMRGGAEHEVADAAPFPRVIKDLNASAIATQSLYDYFTDHELSNHFFSDDVRLQGFYENKGTLHVVTSQPIIIGTHPDLPVMKEKLEAQGLESESPTGSVGTFTIHDERAGDINVIDVKPDNVVLEKSTGIVRPIDVHFYFDNHADRLMALNRLGLRPTASSSPKGYEDQGIRAPAPKYTTDAQVYADYPDAVGVYHAADGSWVMPIILGATEFVPVVEMPEIIELWRELTGAVPVVRKKTGKALGHFTPVGAGRVTLRADLFQDEKSALMTLMHEIGHGFHFMDDRTMAKGNILGIIAGLVAHMKHSIPAVPGLEAPEGWGWSGKGITRKERAEILARAEADLVSSLEGSMRRVIMEEPVYAQVGVTPEDIKELFMMDGRNRWPELYNWFATLHADVKKDIVKRAMRGLMDARAAHLTRAEGEQIGTAQVEREVGTPGRPPTPAEVRDALDAAMRAEMESRNIVDLKYVRDELVALSKWWKPYPTTAEPKYIAYRESGAELYADAMSVLLNSPEDLKSRAPVFWATWWQYLDARPKLKAKLLEVQDRILTGREAVLSRREELLSQAQAAGAKIFLDKLAEAKARRESLVGWWDDLRDQYVDKYFPLNQAVARARAAGKVSHAGEDAVRWITEIHPMAEGRLQVALADIGRVYQRLDALRIPRADLGKYMQYDRIAHERIEITREIDGEMEVVGETGRVVMANPGGETARTAQEMLDRWERMWGREKWSAVQAAAADFRAVVRSVNDRAYEAGLFSDDLWALIEGNDVYAAFTPLKWVNEFLPAGIKKQIGTFEAVADVGQQTVLKMVAIFRAAENNDFLAKTVQALREVLPEAVRDAPVKFNGKVMEPQRPLDSGWKLVAWKVKGKLVGVHVKDRYAEMWARHSPSERNAIATLLLTGFARTVYNTFIRYNPAFQLIRGPVMDLQRSMTNMPGGIKGRGMLVSRLMDPKVWAAARDWARGDVGNSKLMREMIEAGAVGGPHTAFGGSMASPDDAIDGMLKKFHLVNDHKNRGLIVNMLMGPFRAIEYIGQIFQMVPKSAAYRVLREDLGLPKGQVAATVRNHIGLPHTYKKGTRVSETQALVPFLNIFFRSYESFYRNATGKERAQSAGAWWLAWALTGGGLSMILQTLAREGLLGDDLRRKYERISEWDLSTYMVAPIGEVPTGERGGKTVYLRLPQDESVRVVNSVMHKSLTMAIRAAKGAPQRAGLGDIATGATSTVPGINPILSVATTWALYMAGNNPPNGRGGKILTDDEAGAGGWPANSKMLGWTLTETGVANFFSYDPKANSTAELVVSGTPVLKSVIKITDRGLQENEEAQQRQDDRLMQRVRAELPKEIQGLRTEYYWLQSHGDRRTVRQENRYGELALWMKSYRRTMTDVETSLEMHNRAAADADLRGLVRDSREYLQR